MKIWKTVVLFYIGGTDYMVLEFLWRGRSHGSMFLLGGLCFLIMGAMGALRGPLSLRSVAGAAVVTALEYGTGRLCNRQYTIWDYRRQPLNLQGQICLAYSLLWIPVSLLGMGLYRLAERLVEPISSAGVANR